MTELDNESPANKGSDAQVARNVKNNINDWLRRAANGNGDLVNILTNIHRILPFQTAWRPVYRYQLAEDKQVLHWYCESRNITHPLRQHKRVTPYEKTMIQEIYMLLEHAKKSFFSEDVSVELVHTKTENYPRVREA